MSHSGKFDEILFKQRFPEFDNLQRVTPRDEAGNDIEWMTEIRNRLRGISDFYSDKDRPMPVAILRPNLDAAVTERV